MTTCIQLQEALTLDTLNIAIATRNSGGTVVCQVERISKTPLASRIVKLPGITKSMFIDN